MSKPIGFNRDGEDKMIANKQLTKAAEKVKYWTEKLTTALAEVERLNEGDQ